MKPIRTALFTLLATLVLLPGITSCSDDDNSRDKAEELLTGQWMLSADFTDDEEVIIMTLNADNTGNMENNGEVTANFTWSYDTPSHVLTLTPNGQPPITYKVISVSCCELRLDDSVEDAPILFERLK